jgi:inosine triphosphate pyrophosphatase
MLTLQGVTRGKIVSPRGEGGFGWDVCFQPDGYEITYGEMSSEEKNKISHRKRAIEAMRDHFKDDQV